MSEATNDTVDQPSDADLAEAKEMGWAPLEEFRGDKAKWIDAPTFLARGRDVMPLLRTNNERLRGELRQDREKIKQLEAKIAAGDESVQELMKHHQETVQRKVAEAREQLLAEIKTARKDDDPDAEIAAIGNLSKFDAEQAAPKPAAKGNGEDTSGASDRQEVRVEPWFTDWLAANPWAKEPSRKSRMANVLAVEMRADPKYKDLKGAAFLDKVTEMTEQELGTGGDSRVEGSGHTSSGGSGNGKGFSSLPRDAQDAARQQAAKMVGEGRAFKTDKAWFDYYAANY